MVISILLSLAVCVIGDVIPADLQQALSARAFLNGEIEWVHDAPEAGTSRWTKTRYSSKDIQSATRFERQDEPGRSLLGSLANVSTRLGDKYYDSNGRFLSARESSQSDDYPIFDPRIWGFFPGSGDPTRDFGALAADLEVVLRQCRSTTREVDGLREVTAETERARFVWLIDPQKDFVLVRSESWVDGALVGRWEFDIEEYDGTWFYRTARRWSAVDGEPLKQVSTVHVKAARINDPALPALNLLDAGIDAGTGVRNRQTGMELIFDGDDLVSPEEWVERLKSGDATPGQHHLRSRYLNRIDQRVRQQMRRPSEWRQLVDDFVRVYKLDAEQEQKAMAVLAEAERVAEPIMRRFRDTVDERQKIVNAIMGRVAGSISPADIEFNNGLVDRAAQSLEKEFAPHLQPLRDIQAKELMRPLYKLLTRQQASESEDRVFIDKWSIQR